MKNQFMEDCAPHFFDGLMTAVEYARRIQTQIQETIDERRGEICEALGYREGEVSIGEYWHPAKIQSATADDYTYIGVKLKVSSFFEMVLSYGDDGERPWLAVWLSMKPKAALGSAAEALTGPLSQYPEQTGEWDSEDGTSCVLYIDRSNGHQLKEPVDRLLDHYLSAVRQVGGVKRILVGHSADRAVAV